MQCKNKHIVRYLVKRLKRLIKNRFSALILGPRQAGKTTAYGSMPGIVCLPERNRGDFLKSYANIYLEEDIGRSGSGLRDRYGG